MVKHGIRSMTGFAARRGAAEGYDWLWDIRSVNGKGLDLRLRVPDGIEGLEQAARARVSAGLGRGNVTLSLKLDRAAGEAAARVNAVALDAALMALAQVRARAEADRVAQELALMVVKADVTEELDRLSAHIAAARALLSEKGAVGRKFDFLMQEFMREANTLCSKSGNVALTRIGLVLNTVIDQMREQVQNVE